MMSSLDMHPGFSHFLFSKNEPLPNKSSEDINCNIFPQSNNTVVFLNVHNFNSIPINLGINIITWLLLLILFSLLRKRAWNYGRLALVQKDDQKWTSLFYGEGGTTSQILNEETESVDSFDMNLAFDKGFFSWFKAIFKVKDEQILKKCGHDAVQYLSFQRHIIVYVAVICVISLCIVLPVNLQGNLEGNSTTYSHTTLTNLSPESSLLWIHVLLSFLFLLLVIIFLRHFSLTLKFEEKNLTTGTLMVDGIPRDYCYKDYLIQHFQEAYPECIVQDIQFAYDINHLNKLDKKREIATQARIWCEKELNETGVRPKIRPYKCGRICFSSCCCKEVDGLDFYMREEHTLTTAVEKEKSFALLRPLGIAFVTFQNETMAELVYKDHQKQCKCNTNPPSSSLSRVLNPHDWKVTIAPAPEDILWENLTQKKVQWYLRAFFINFGLFIFLFFCTTPPYLIFLWNKINENMLDNINSVFSELFQTFLLWAVSVILPIAVAYTDQFLFHWTRSSYNHSVMVKTFLFLIFMILILQSLGLTSLRYLVEEAIKDKGQSPRWGCIFLSDSGAVYVNYVITASFIGTAMELIRFPELFLFACYLAFSRSKAEQATVRKAAMWEFEFGVQYAWFLLVFAIVITYSLACPLVVPFGLVYLCFKHCVDRYNIYFAYAPSKISQNIHVTAINFVIISVFLLQVFLFFFSYVRKGLSYITIVSLAILVFTLMIFSVRIFHNWFRQLSPITYKHLNRKADSSENGIEQNSSFSAENKLFTPKILKHSSQDFFISNSRNLTYGTNEHSVAATPEKETHGSVISDSEVPYQRY